MAMMMSTRGGCGWAGAMQSGGRGSMPMSSAQPAIKLIEITSTRHVFRPFHDIAGKYGRCGTVPSLQRPGQPWRAIS